MHFKGNKYEVIALARDYNTNEEMILYRPLYGDSGLWLRPKKMFMEKVKTLSGYINRFSVIEKEEYEDIVNALNLKTGNLFECMARHSETNDEYMVYEDPDSDYELFAVQKDNILMKSL